MIRLGQVTRLRPEKAEEYRTLHADVWPSVLEMITACNIRNYSIFIHDDMLFSYFEYHGVDWDGDQAKMAAHPQTRQWWELTDVCQMRVVDDGIDRPWAEIEEVFHHD